MAATAHFIHDVSVQKNPGTPSTTSVLSILCVTWKSDLHRQLPVIVKRFKCRVGGYEGTELHEYQAQKIMPTFYRAKRPHVVVSRNLLGESGLVNITEHGGRWFLVNMTFNVDTFCPFFASWRWLWKIYNTFLSEKKGFLASEKLKIKIFFLSSVSFFSTCFKHFQREEKTLIVISGKNHKTNVNLFPVLTSSFGETMQIVSFNYLPSP